MRLRDILTEARYLGKVLLANDTALMTESTEMSLDAEVEDKCVKNNNFVFGNGRGCTSGESLHSFGGFGKISAFKYLSDCFSENISSRSNVNVRVGKEVNTFGVMKKNKC